MKKEIVVLALVLGTLALRVEGAGRPEVSICQPADCQNIEDLFTQRCQESRAYVARLAHNDEIVLKNYDLLAIELENAFRKDKSLKAEEVDSIFSAIDFAAEKHRLQMRKNKEKTPYISHPLGVAYYLVYFGEVSDAAVIIGALLHDTLEIGAIQEVEKRFGKDVAGHVREMSEDQSLSYVERKRQQVIHASKCSKGAAQIHLADKLYNAIELLRNPPEGWSSVRIDRYYQWMQSIIERLPQANDALKKEVEKIIDSYWESQKQS